MLERTRAQEYDTLRQELLLLAERAHDIWRWGLVSMLAIFWAIAQALIDILGHPSPSSLTEFVKAYGGWLAIALCALAAGVAVAMSHLRLRTQDEMHRIGAYLAVFHDKGLDSSFNKDLGWHVWNRIDKCDKSVLTFVCRSFFYFLHAHEPDTDVTTALQQREIHGGHYVYLLVLAFIVISTLAVVAAAGKVAMCGAVLVGALGWLGVAVLLFWLNRMNGRGQARWNRRWAGLSRLNKDQVNAALLRSGLGATADAAQQ